MALQGTLDTFSLPDVLRLLATTAKTGRLRIEGDRGRGSVWLSDGRIVDADAERAVEGTPTEEVVFELLRFDAGSFAFDGDDKAAGGGEAEDVEALLRRANALLSEWSELEAVVPSLQHQVSLAGDLPADEVTIDADRWKSVVAIAEGKTVGELARALGLTELGVSRAVRDLVDLGVAEVGTPRTPTEAPRVAPAGRDLARAATGPESVAPVGRQGPLTGETRRAGWLRTGEVPAVGADRGPSASGNGQGRASLDDTVASPAARPSPNPPEPPKGGLASRLGRGRSASTGPRGAQPPATGATPAVSNGAGRSTGRTPVTPPPSRTNDAGRARNGTADTGPVARHDRGAPRSAPEGEGRRPGGPSSRGAGTPPPASPGRGGRTLGSGPSPFDNGRLGPPPASRDTGQIRPVTPPSLPPDLQWAADDTGSGTLNGGPPTSPFSGLTSLGPTNVDRTGRGHLGGGMPPARPGPADGEIAPHVAAMSPEARAAVQATVGNAGGATAGRGMGPDDLAQRGRLISFLSTVR